MATLYVVGIGPGDVRFMTEEARTALDRCDLFCGYTTYLELVRGFWPDKPCITTPMTRELERCHLALQAAAEGKTVAMICSGDAGVYGMAGPIFELQPQYPSVNIEIIPGVSAVLSGAARLGAPLMHDFAVISLSDLLTPMDRICKRLKAAAEGDFCICLYNPSSRKRPDYLQRACDILLETLKPETACGWVRNIGRSGETLWTGTLEQLRTEKVDMFTTVFIGNSETRLINGRMVTPRGYQNKT